MSLSADVAADLPRVLLADDTAEVQVVARKALVSAGMEVTTCDDGKGVLNAVGDGGFDLIILDSTLPDMSGTELCRRLTLSPQLADTPILLLKADGRNESKLEILEVGAFDFVHLPLDPQELIIRAKAALRFKALRDELRAKSRELIHEHEAEAQLERTIQQVRASWGICRDSRCSGSSPAISLRRWIRHWPRPRNKRAFSRPNPRCRRSCSSN